MSEIFKPFLGRTQEEINQRLREIYGQTGNSLLANFQRQLDQMLANQRANKQAEQIQKQDSNQ